MHRYQRQFKALGSEILLTLITSKNKADSDKLFKRLYGHITDFEQQFSRFLPDSELTKFNHAAGQRVVTSPSFRELLVTAKKLALQTKGLYNPFVLPALQKSGYLGSWPRPEVGLTATDFTDRAIVPVTKLTIGDAWAKIPKDSALDFGGIGKGYLLDELAKSLDKERLEGYWLSLGGDIICAGHDLDKQPWQIAVQNALELDLAVDMIVNENNQKLAIATSGITKRQGIKNNKPWHHIIDPRTAQPAESNILSVTVTAENAVTADVYAKCIVIAGARQAQAYKDKAIIQSFIIQR